jgi:hypothetical protein
MAKYTTYSFGDVVATLNFAGIVPLTLTGEGVGSINTAMATDKTAHDVAADGSVMTSKILGNNGTIAIEIQQSSPAHKLLLLWYNYILNAPSSEWANNSITIRNNVIGETILCEAVAPQKLPDKPYQASGQKVTWNLMAANITQLPA